MDIDAVVGLDSPAEVSREVVEVGTEMDADGVDTVVPRRPRVRE